MTSNLERFISNLCCNSCQSFYDLYVEANVRFRSAAGMKMVIIRRQLGNCCDWCKNLAGIYSPWNAPKDIYRRHSNCRCLVTTRTEEGYQNVWNKKVFQTQREARIQASNSFAYSAGRFRLNIQFFANITTPEKIEQFIKEIKDGLINTKLRHEKQRDHIYGTKAFKRRIDRADKGTGLGMQSYFFEGTDVMKLIGDRLGTGEIVFDSNKRYPREFLDFDYCIGKWYNLNTKQYEDAYRVIVQYGENGIHAYPCKSKE